MNLRVSYVAEWRYDAPIVEQHVALRLRPASSSTQAVRSFELTIDPGARTHPYRDYFGTDVVEFDIPEPHDRLVVEARAQVITSGAEAPLEQGFEAIESQAYREAGAEFRLTAGTGVERLHKPDEPPVEQSGGSLLDDAGSSPLCLLVAVCEHVAGRFDADHAAAALVLLHGRGLAARRVAGYLLEDDGAAEHGDRLQAWIEVLLPSRSGPVWVGADPRTGQLTGERHVKVAHGRHADDVPAMRGAHRGGDPTHADVIVMVSQADG